MATFTAVITGVSTPILLCNVVGNILVILVIKKNKKLHNANAFLLANLAASDVTFAILSLVIFRLPQHSGSIWINSLGEFILHALASIYILVALAVERYFAILKPFVHLARAVKSLMWKVLLATWIFAGILSSPAYPIAVLTKENAKENAMMNVTLSGAPVWLKPLSTVYIFVIFTFGLALPSAVMIFCYSRVIYHAWFNTKANRVTNLALLQSRHKLTKLFIVVTLIFLITWTPTFGTLILQFLRKENSWKFELFSISLALVGSAANPVIYSFRCPRFRQEVVKLLSVRCCSQIKTRLNVTRPFVANRYSVQEMEEWTTSKTVEPVLISVRK